MYLETSPMMVFSLASNTPLIPEFYVLIFKIDGEETIMEEIRKKISSREKISVIRKWSKLAF